MPKTNTGPRIKWRGDRHCYEIQEFVAGKRKRLATGIESKPQAEAELEEILGRRRRKTGQRDLSERLIDDSLADYLDEHGRHAVSAIDISYNIESLSRFWGRKTINDISKSTCREYADFRRKESSKKGRGLSDSTIRRELQILRAAINHDHKEKRIGPPPFVHIPPAAPPKDDWLTRQELAKLIRAARKNPQSRWHLPWFIVLSYYSGQRKSTILSARWPQIDFKGNKIDWNASGRHQTNKRRPRQPMDDKTRLFLSLLKKRGQDMGYILHRNQSPIADIKKSFAAAKRRAGLDHITPHTLRHTAITHTLQNGISIWDTSGFFGVSAKVIESTYGHHAEDYLIGPRDARARPKHKK